MNHETETFQEASAAKKVVSIPPNIQVWILLFEKPSGLRPWTAFIKGHDLQLMTLNFKFNDL